LGLRSEADRCEQYRNHSIHRFHDSACVRRKGLYVTSLLPRRLLDQGVIGV
jgi:hypothetical protein